MRQYIEVDCRSGSRASPRPRAPNAAAPRPPRRCARWSSAGSSSANSRGRIHDRCVGICYLEGQDISEIMVRRGLPGLPPVQRRALCRSGTASCCRRRDDRPGVHTAGVLPAALIQLPGIRCHTHADPRASRIKVGAGLRQLALEPPEPLQLIANGMSLGLLAQTTRWVNPGPDHPETAPSRSGRPPASDARP